MNDSKGHKVFIVKKKSNYSAYINNSVVRGRRQKILLRSIQVSVIALTILFLKSK